MNLKPLGTTVILGLLASSTAWADNEFYCGTHIITEGLTKEQVSERCGDPEVQTADQWTYNRGPDEFDVQLDFDGDNTVESITELTEKTE